MNELEEQKRQVNLKRLLELKSDLNYKIESSKRKKRLLELKSDLNYKIGSSKRKMAELDVFKAEKDISVTIRESYNNSVRLDVPKDIVLKMIGENIESKESKLAEVEKEIAAEINHLAKGDKP